MDLGGWDDDHHDRNDKVYVQAGERDGWASKPLKPRIRTADYFLRLRTIHDMT